MEWWDEMVVKNGSQFAESELRDDSDSRSLFAWAWLLVRWCDAWRAAIVPWQASSQRSAPCSRQQLDLSEFQ